MKYEEYKKIFYQKAGINRERLLSNEHILWLLEFIRYKEEFITDQAHSFLKTLSGRCEFTEKEKILLHYLYERLIEKEDTENVKFNS